MWLQNFEQLYDGWHAAIYVSDFSGAFRAMEAAGLIFTEHGFFDADISGLRDAQKYHQFRFQASRCHPCAPIPALLSWSFSSLGPAVTVLRQLHLSESTGSAMLCEQPYSDKQSWALLCRQHVSSLLV